MKVKPILKTHGITLKQFSEDLNIARPTLNSYISLFENCKEIPNEKYNTVFERLFSGHFDDSDEFFAEFDRLKYMLQRDSLIGVINYDLETTDAITSMIEIVREDVDKGEHDNDIYTFIVMLLKSYRREPLFKKLATYFLYLNGIYDKAEIDEKDKPFLSNLYRILHTEKYDHLELDVEYFEKFLAKIDEINNKRDLEKNEFKENLVRDNIGILIDQAVQEKINMGFDIEDIDKEEILRKVLKC